MKKLLITFIFFIAIKSVFSQQDKPNIILIMADDLGYECLGTYGSAEYQTPNLDQLAENGVKFNHCYAQPLCTPSRVKIMTGKYNFRNYEKFDYLDPNQRTFANYLKSAGYATCIAGKWQLNGIYGDKKPAWDDLKRPYQFGFDEYCLWQLHKSGGEGGGKYNNPLIVENEREWRATIDDYGPDIYTNYILDFIGRKKDQPFFVYYPMGLTHAPFHPTPDSEVWNYPSRRREDDPKYFPGMVAYMDKLVGKIMDKLDEEGIAKNTLVIFTGDNGTHSKITTKMKDGRLIQGGKSEMTDAGTRVPLIAYLLGKSAKGLVLDDLIGFEDFLPALCDAAGAEIPEDHVIDGISFLPQVLGKAGKPRDMLYMYYQPLWMDNQAGCFVRDQQYKLYGDGRFYHVANDPLEVNNLSVSKLSITEKKLKNKFKDYLNEMPCPE